MSVIKFEIRGVQFNPTAQRWEILYFCANNIQYVICNIYSKDIVKRVQAGESLYLRKGVLLVS